MLVWTANNWKMASVENQKVEKVGQELAHSARASFVSVVIHRRLIFVRHLQGVIAGEMCSAVSALQPAPCGGTAERVSFV